MREIAAAYVCRDWLVWSSYRFNAAMHLVGVVVMVVLIATVGDAIAAGGSQVLHHSEDYASFVLAGLAFSDPFFSGLTAPPKAVREGQVSGTLEPVLLAPVGDVQLILGASTFALLQSIVRSLLIVGVSVAALGYWQHPNALAVLVVAVPGWLGFLGMGMLAAAVIIVVKQGDPVVVGYAAISAILGGAFVPVDSLPGWLQAIGGVLPLTHALEGIRMGLEGEAVSAVAGHAGLLAVLALLTVPVGLVAVRRAFRYAKEQGSLVHY